MEKKDWFAKLHFGICGCDGHTLFKDMTREQAEREAYEETLEWASSYGFEQDEEAFGDLDTVGADFDEETGEYSQTRFIDSVVEEYDPEQHDGYLY